MAYESGLTINIVTLKLSLLSFVLSSWSSPYTTVRIKLKQFTLHRTSIAAVFWVPKAVSIYSSSSADIRGCTDGVSYTKNNHPIVHNRVTIPGTYITLCYYDVTICVCFLSRNVPERKITMILEFKIWVVSHNFSRCHSSWELYQYEYPPRNGKC